VSLQALGNDRATTTGWAHSRNENDIDDRVEGLFFAVTLVPAGVVHELTEQFNGRLGTILFLGRHVEIIDEDDVLLAERWAIDTLTSLFEFVIEVILGLISRCLGREAHDEGLIFFRHLEGHQFGDVDGFTGTGGTGHQNVLVVHDKGPHQVLHTDGVLGGHDNFSIGNVGVDDVLVDGGEPGDPFTCLKVVLPVVHLLFLREVSDSVLGHALTAPFVPSLTANSISCATDRPGQAEEEDVLELLLQFLNLFRSNLLDLGLNVLDEIAVKETHE